jgi:hypothetical protein
MTNSDGSATRFQPISIEPQRTDASFHVSPAEVAAAPWHKSSWSSCNGNCVEVAELQFSRVCLCDTKTVGAGPILVFTHAEWNLFLSSVKKGDLARVNDMALVGQRSLPRTGRDSGERGMSALVLAKVAGRSECL